ncbi:unnamed protein product [Toxocara canis]|uniref:BZIP domain-containing protein n=1 Tax=Toxocara canis TaxID=6265 RepID=A0A183UGA2_TOXCA|nr:unnamed protein product [Toxocara canis]
MTGRGGARKRQVNPELLSDEEYVLKRQRNNDAVNRTRQKKRQEETDTSMRVEELRNENTQLERKVRERYSYISFSFALIVFSEKLVMRVARAYPYGSNYSDYCGIYAL